MGIWEERDIIAACLKEHLEVLQKQEQQVKDSIAQTTCALEVLGRLHDVSAKEAFNELKSKAIVENERVYGKEACE